MRYLILLLLFSCTSLIDPVTRDAIFQMDTKDFVYCGIDTVIITLSSGEVGYLRRPENSTEYDPIMVEYREEVVGPVDYRAVSTNGAHTWTGVVGNKPIQFCCGESCD